MDDDLPDDNAPHDRQPGDDQSISLEELSQSFAQLLGERKPAQPDPAQPDPTVDATTDDATADDEVYSLEDDCPPNPRSILEAMLFVGHPSNESLTNRQMASLIRGVSPDEIDSLVQELNASYESNAAPYRIVLDSAGYRMALTDEHESLRESFYGRIRRARLSQSAIDVLALVAYKQPMTQKDVESMRQRPSGTVLSQLVKRGLLQTVEVEGKTKRKKAYQTTDRFLELFHLDSLDDLPHSQDMGPAT